MESKAFNIINANIISLEDKNPNPSSITVRNGIIQSIDNPNPYLENISLDGATVIPGFIDSHFHLRNLGKRLDMVQLKRVDSLKKIQKLVIDECSNKKPGELILGFGWDQNLWESKDFPSSDILNSIAPDHPVIFTRIDGHATWVNQKCLDQVGYSVEDGIPDGGDIINNCILIDNAMSITKELNQENTLENVKKWIKNATDIIVKRGVCSVHDAWQNQTIIDAIHDLIREDEFPIRCYGMIDGSDRDLCDKFFNNGFFSSEKYNIRSVKAFIDGALGSRGAALIEPYSDDTHNCGLILITHDEFNNLAKRCADSNFQLNTHAIGDKGNQIVIDTYSNNIKNSNHRWRIEHAQMVTSKDIDRMIENHIVPSMQPSHCTSDMNWLPDRIGQHRLHRISRWKTFINKGAKIAGGSDCPIEEGNPLFEFYAAITRQDHQGFPNKGFQEQECVSPIEALKMLTTWGARAEFQDSNKGIIKPGYKADLTVLSDNITTIDPSKILNTKVLATIVGGQFVFNQL
tara:strand:- start:2963 stop:4513 length:1551 start_codon:yes stop_codon:yes gene_type:complete